MKKSTEQENLEKFKNAVTRGLVSLEIIQLKEFPNSIEEAEKIYSDNVKVKIVLVDDLSKPYMLRAAYTENKPKLKSVDPEFIPEGDAFELSESIQELLQELKLPIIQSNFPKEPTDVEDN